LLSFFLQSIAQVAAEKSFFLRLPINMVIRNTNSQPIVQQTAKEFMFGYKSKLATLGNTLLPDWIYFDKVGLIDRVSGMCVCGWRLDIWSRNMDFSSTDVRL
jgi:CD36 family